MLKKFRQAKDNEIQRLLNNKIEIEKAVRNVRERPSFASALKKKHGRISVIAEYKRASPSKGLIRQKLDFDNVISGYEVANANAVSILTENEFFMGEFDHLERAWRVLKNKNIPILRKDFIFHPLQIMETAKSPAAALLLIVRAAPDTKTLRDFYELTNKLNLEAVVEVFDKSDLVMAREIGAEIIQVNARDLNTLQVSRQATLKFIDQNPPKSGEVWIAASGISTTAHLKSAAEAGYNACLIGSALMEKPDPGQALLEIVNDL